MFHQIMFIKSFVYLSLSHLSDNSRDNGKKITTESAIRKLWEYYSRTCITVFRPLDGGGDCSPCLEMYYL